VAQALTSERALSECQFLRIVGGYARPVYVDACRSSAGHQIKCGRFLKQSLRLWA
jgi:hypothetical protein